MRKLFRRGPDSAAAQSGPALFAWQPEGNFLATTSGSAGPVRIWDRHGDRIGEVDLVGSNGHGSILAIEWDCSGECIAVLQEGNGVVALWDIKDRQVQKLETNLRDPTFLRWSKVGPELAVGTAKGNLLIYNKLKNKKIPVMGKHPRRITCGAWSQTNKLALGSEDRIVTISDNEGNTDHQRDLKHSPKEMAFAIQKGSDRQSETHLSINMSQSLLLLDLDEPENPLELAFQNKYGYIVSHVWFDEGHILLGFSEGFLVVISTSLKEIGEERYSARFHNKQLYDVAYSPIMKVAACAGDTGVKLVDCKNGFENLKPDSIDLSGDGSVASSVGWSPDGQILTVGTSNGFVHAFLARMRKVYGSFRSVVAHLSSLREISVVDARAPKLPPVRIPVAIEPQFIAVGSNHAAVGSNNRVFYYRCSANNPALVCEEEYALGRVDAICLNDRLAAVLTRGTVTLHEIEAGEDGTRRRKHFPNQDADQDSRVSCVAITPNFLIYGTNAGTVEFCLLDEEWDMLDGATLRHTSPIKAIYPNPSGTRIVLLDNGNQAFVGNPVTAEMTPFPQFPSLGVQTVMWDVQDQGLIMAWDRKDLHSFIYCPSTRMGPVVSKLGAVTISPTGEINMRAEALPLPAGCDPIVACGGVITCQDSTGDVLTVPTPVSANVDRHDKMLFEFTQRLMRLQLRQAWDAALALNDRGCWLALSNKAMEVMDIDMALRVYRELGDAGMVMGLEQIAEIEDTNLLAGHVALLYDDWNKAQELFLASSRPVAALEMRRDLLHWDHALKLAHTLAPRQVPEISVEYARQLEFRGEYQPALSMFESAINTTDDELGPLERGSGGSGGARSAESHDAIQTLCLAGIARCTLRLGDLRRGISYVKQADSPQLCQECARILESMKQLAEAASLYEMGGQHERAAAIYIKTKQLQQAASIMPLVTQPKLHSAYASKCEREGQYEEAAASFEKAHDMDSVVRLCLDHLGRPERAFEIVRSTSSSTGAQLVAYFCQRESNFRGAIEFLLMAKCSDEAFALAKTHDCMDVYTTVLGDAIGPDEASSVASYYEGQHELGKAGHFYSRCGQYARALKLFLQCGEREVDRAIEVVGKARNDMLTHTLIDFLMGETDGVPKEPFHIYRLYLALGNYTQAAKTAFIISRQEQDLGNYIQAHEILYETIRRLEDQKVRVPQNLRRPFTLLHSYVLVKKLAKRGDHAGAARMLLRVAKSISKFPCHIVPILTSTVIEASRAGLKASALEYATMLMRPEYRQQVAPKFKRQIANMVRRPNREEEPEALSACPISNHLIPITTLECPTTKDAIPMCVVTGQHIIAEDCCICPNSNMPALYSEYSRYIAQEALTPEQLQQHAAAAAAAASEGEGGAAAPPQAAPSASRRSPAAVDLEPKALDPVTSKPVAASQLTKLTAEEVAAFIATYNQPQDDGGKAEDGADDQSGQGSKTKHKR